MGSHIQAYQKYPFDLENLFLESKWVEDEVFEQNVCIRGSERPKHCSVSGVGGNEGSFVIVLMGFVPVCAKNGRMLVDRQTLFLSTPPH